MSRSFTFDDSHTNQCIHISGNCKGRVFIIIVGKVDLKRSQKREHEYNFFLNSIRNALFFFKQGVIFTPDNDCCLRELHAEGWKFTVERPIIFHRQEGKP